MMTLVKDDCLNEILTPTPARSAAPGRIGFASTSERRRGLRIRQARPVKLFEPCGTHYYGGQTEDISATGLRIELPASAPLQAGDIVSIHVGLARDGASLANRKQLMPARVVWIDRSFTRDYAIAGIEFLASISAHLDAA